MKVSVFVTTISPHKLQVILMCTKLSIVPTRPKDSFELDFSIIIINTLCRKISNQLLSIRASVGPLQLFFNRLKHCFYYQTNSYTFCLICLKGLPPCGTLPFIRWVGEAEATQISPLPSKIWTISSLSQGKITLLDTHQTMPETWSQIIIILILMIILKCACHSCYYDADLIYVIFATN